MRTISSILGFIITTFVCAIIYGMACSAIDVLNGQEDPIVTGREAAAHVYGLFGEVAEETNNADGGHPASTSLARKIAAPYAITADLTAMLSGKLVHGIGSLFNAVDNSVDQKAKESPRHN